LTQSRSDTFVQAWFTLQVAGNLRLMPWPRAPDTSAFQTIL
jgi:hypothetical protein